MIPGKNAETQLNSTGEEYQTQELSPFFGMFIPLGRWNQQNLLVPCVKPLGSSVGIKNTQKNRGGNFWHPHIPRPHQARRWISSFPPSLPASSVARATLCSPSAFMARRLEARACRIHSGKPPMVEDSLSSKQTSQIMPPPLLTGIRGSHGAASIKNWKPDGNIYRPSQGG